MLLSYSYLKMKYEVMSQVDNFGNFNVEQNLITKYIF